MTLPLFEDLFAQLIEILPRLGAAALILILAWILSRWVNRAAHRALARRNADEEITILFDMLIRWGILILGTVVALEQIAPGQLGALIAGLGIAGFTIGFALQDVAKNFIAGIILLLQEPFSIGETIEVSGFNGTVLNITLRTTEMRTADGLHVTIPNGEVLINPIVNYSRVPQRRVELKVGVAYDTDLEAAARVALDALQTIPGVLELPGPEVVFQTFGDSAIAFTAYYWYDTAQVGLFAAQDAGVKALQTAFVQAKIEIPYPIQTVIQPEPNKH